MPIRRRRTSLPVSLALFCLLVIVRTADALGAGPEAQDLKRLTLEQLMQIDVTIATRQAEPIGTAAAAVSVITGDDIRRSGATTIADALALADGVQVARFNNGTWAISARGFDQNAANKLLVMVDGRTVYSPLFSGAFWNTIDYVLDDVERIEIVRGPGATLWGANAVNGVVNIITRSAADTQGAFVSVSTGNEDHGIVETRYGGRTGSAAWRVYAKFADRDAQRLENGTSAGDARARGQAGFRIDGGAADAANWLIRGDAFHSRDGLPGRPDGEFTDIDLQGRWSAPAAGDSRVTVQSYFRREYRRVPQQLTHYVDVMDLDAQQSATWRARHSIVWGGGFRVNWDQTFPGPAIHFDPAARTYNVGNVFAQDEVTLIPDRLSATLGAKWEHTTFTTGGDFQPNLRARVLLPRRQVLWGAVSRAVRRPTRFEEDLVIAAPNGLPVIRGDDNFVAEVLVASEIGYRVQPVTAVSLDATVFHHDYHDLRSQDLPLGGGLPLIIGNSLQGRANGLELAINVQPIPAWRTHVSYTWLDVLVERAPGSRDTSGGLNEGNDPPHMFSLHTSLDLKHGVQLDAMLRAVAALPRPVVPGYTELNLRGGWQATRRVELFVAGQDLLHDRHAEFAAPGAGLEEFERAVRVGANVRF
jgi:iron complex outermembrane receptor protein